VLGYGARILAAFIAIPKHWAAGSGLKAAKRASCKAAPGKIWRAQNALGKYDRVGLGPIRPSSPDPGRASRTVVVA
jgi:hypothetical protein